MNFAPLYINASSEYQDNSMLLDIGTNMSNSEPVCIANNLTQEPIQIRDNLLNLLNNKDILPIDDQEFKCEKIDTIVNQIKSLNEELLSLQDQLDEYYSAYQEEIKKTKENVDKIDCSIQFIKTCNKEYESNEKIKSIIDSLNEYIKTISDNDKLKEAKQEYINKRKLINKHLCLINAVNKFNVAAICPICLTDKIDSYCNPCGHTACKACLDKTSSIVNNMNYNKCPICREHVMDIRKLYFI